jgi:hypothetical protein
MCSFDAAGKCLPLEWLRDGSDAMLIADYVAIGRPDRMYARALCGGSSRTNA